MTDISIQTDTQTQIDHDGDSMPCVRVYGASPEQTVIQIRTYGSLTGNRNGKTRPAYSSAYLDAKQIVELRAVLLTELERLKSLA